MEEFFYAKYKRIKRSELLPNIILKRAAQQGRGLLSALKKIAKNPAVRKLAKKGLSYVPQVYNYS